MKIKITQEDINKGRPGSPTACPIAQGLKRMGFRRPQVCNSVHCSGWGTLWVDLPLKALKFVGDFDNVKRVKPFEFELNATP